MLSKSDQLDVVLICLQAALKAAEHFRKEHYGNRFLIDETITHIQSAILDLEITIRRQENV